MKLLWKSYFIFSVFEYVQQNERDCLLEKYRKMGIGNSGAQKRWKKVCKLKFLWFQCDTLSMAFDNLFELHMIIKKMEQFPQFPKRYHWNREEKAYFYTDCRIHASRNDELRRGRWKSHGEKERINRVQMQTTVIW